MTLVVTERPRPGRPGHDWELTQSVTGLCVERTIDYQYHPATTGSVPAFPVRRSYNNAASWHWRQGKWPSEVSARLSRVESVTRQQQRPTIDRVVMVTTWIIAFPGRAGGRPCGQSFLPSWCWWRQPTETMWVRTTERPAACAVVPPHLSWPCVTVKQTWRHRNHKAAY